MYSAFHMNETAKKRGRPKGSTSFTRVNITDLTNAVGRNASIVVSKKWMEEIGLTVDPVPVKVISAQTTEETEEKVQFSVHTFDQ